MLFFAAPLVSSELTLLINFFFFFLIFFHTLYVQGPEEAKLIQAQFNRYSCGNQFHHRNYTGYLRVYGVDPGTFEESGVLNQSLVTDNRLLIYVLQEIRGVMGFLWGPWAERPWEASWSRANLN